MCSVIDKTLNYMIIVWPSQFMKLIEIVVFIPFGWNENGTTMVATVFWSTINDSAYILNESCCVVDEII